MKKLWPILLCAALLCGLISGCTMAEKKPLRILVDIEIGTAHSTPNRLLSGMEDQAKTFLTKVKLAGDLEEVEMEYLPYAGSARTETITRIRTEIEEGGGPDVFLCVCPEATLSPELLFPFPEQAMLDGMFLSLDQYIEKAQYTEFDTLQPAVMAAGKTENGQVLLPLSYTFHINIFDRDQLGSSYDQPLSWDEAVATGDPVWLAACDESYRNYFGDMFPGLADYEAGELAFSEEELLRTIRQAVALRKEAKAGDWGITSESFGAPKHTSCRFALMNADNFRMIEIHHSNEYNDHWVEISDAAVDLAETMEEGDGLILPLYNQEAGVTAEITAWAAVNRNTRQPETAFLALDQLLSESCQTSDLYIYFPGIPVSDELGKPGKQWQCGWVTMPFSLSERNFAELNRVRDQISAVRFQTPFDRELSQLFSGCLLAKDDTEIETKVHTVYLNMQEMIQK